MSGQTSFLTGADLVERLESAMLSGEWAQGQQMPSERRLAEQFGVSRPVVREALRTLRERGLITVVPGRGSFAREPRPTEGSARVEHLVRRGRVTARQLIEARRMLECEAAALAARNHDQDDGRRMKALLEAFNTSTQTDASAELDVAFHESIALASGNPVIQIMFGSIRTLVHAVVLRSLTDREVRQAGAPYHDVILEAVLARDADAARAGMADHLTLAEQYYGRDLDLPLADVVRRRADYDPRISELLERVSSSLEADQEALTEPGGGSTLRQHDQQPRGKS